MAPLETLLKVEGVIAAGRFAPDGGLLDYQAREAMSPELAAAAAQYCATVSMLFSTLAPAFSQLSGMNWTPARTWSYSGGDLTVAVSGNTGVFAEAGRVDLARLMNVLQA